MVEFRPRVFWCKKVWDVFTVPSKCGCRWILDAGKHLEFNGDQAVRDQLDQFASSNDTLLCYLTDQHLVVRVKDQPFKECRVPLLGEAHTMYRIFVKLKGENVKVRVRRPTHAEAETALAELTDRSTLRGLLGEYFRKIEKNNGEWMDAYHEVCSICHSPLMYRLPCNGKIELLQKTHYEAFNHDEFFGAMGCELDEWKTDCQS
jgi:hypothetical protein